MTQETISRYETGALPIVPEYRVALAGPLGREARELRGGIVKDPRGLCAVLQALTSLDDALPDVDQTLVPLDDIEL